MEFAIFVRNIKTGLEKEFANMQQIADFLAKELNPEHWFGHQNLGPLPAPTVVAVADAAETVAPVEMPLYMLNGAGEYVLATADDLVNPELVHASVFTKKLDGSYVVAESLPAALPTVSDVIAEAVAPDTNLVATPEQIAAADALPQAPAPVEELHDDPKPEAGQEFQ